MKNDAEIKAAVREKYGQIARGEIDAIAPKQKCCSCGEPAVSSIALDYSKADRASVPEGADLGLGCGTPTAFADLRAGMTVLDLGSGAGIDCFIAAKEVGPAGRIIGVDMTEEMIRKANENKAKVDARNVEFRLGEIENLPVDDGSVDMVISNCVINLVPNKENAFREIFRVLRSGGKFSVSDIVVDGDISEKERRDAALWAGCISGALRRTEYLDTIRRTGFVDVAIVSEKRYEYQLEHAAGLYSITVTGRRS